MKKETTTPPTKQSYVEPVELILLVTGSGKRTDEQAETEILLRSDDATIHLKKDSEFWKLAHTLVDRYNEYPKLQGYQIYVSAKVYFKDENILTFNQWKLAGEPEE